MASGDWQKRWWLGREQTAAVFDGLGELVFEDDDGTVWSFSLLRRDAQPCRFLWDHKGSCFADFDREAVPAQMLGLLEHSLKVMARPVEHSTLQPAHQRVLDTVARSLAQDEWVSGRRLRATLGVSRDAFQPISDSLQPRYLREQTGSSGDFYSLTLPGLMRSAEADAARRILADALAVLAQRYSVDPDFQTFELEEVVTRGAYGTEMRTLILSVIFIASLQAGGGGSGAGPTRNWKFSVPKDLEEIVAGKGVDDLFSFAMRSAQPLRPWPTAPLNCFALDRPPAAFPVPVVAAASSTAPDYDVALSFAGEDRPHAEGVAELLRLQGANVFYDKYEESDLWGKDLYQHLHDVYANRARFCVVFVSRSYEQKLWTTHELKAAQARAFRERREYILPVRVDETLLPGVPETVGYLDISVGYGRIANALIGKLRSPTSGSFAPSARSSPSPSPRSPPVPQLRVDADDYLPVVASLNRKDGGPVPPVIWSLQLELPEPHHRTKAELLTRLNTAVVSYDGLRRHWPRTLRLQDAATSRRADGGHLWVHAYRTEAVNDVGDEQLLLLSDGRVLFQRARLWDIEDSVLDLGEVCFDTLLFALFAARYVEHLGVHGDPTVTLRVRASGIPTIAHWGMGFEPEHPNRTSGTEMQDFRSRRIIPAAVRTDRALLAVEAKRLVDGVANEFELAPSPFYGTELAFTSVDLRSVTVFCDRHL